MKQYKYKTEAGYTKDMLFLIYAKMAEYVMLGFRTHNDMEMLKDKLPSLLAGLKNFLKSSCRNL